MRKTLIASSVAALALAGLAGGVAVASNSEGSPAAAPTTTVAGTDIFNDMGLTPEQGDCLVANVGGVDLNDLTALMELMTQCGISTDQLLQVGEDALAPDTTTLDADTTTLDAVPPADIDPAAAAAVLALLGLDQPTVDCLVSAAETAPPTDDAAAESVFVSCGVGPLQILDAIVALDAAAGDATTPVDTATVTVAPSGSVVSSGNPMVDLLLEQLAAQGITLDAEQGQCLLDNISSLDPNDMTAMLSVFETCGINVADLIPGG
jgi:hypothetical protein